MLVKGTINQEYITTVNIYARILRGHNYTSEILSDRKEHIDSDTIIQGCFNPLSYLYRFSKLKLSKETSELSIL